MNNYDTFTTSSDMLYAVIKESMQLEIWIKKINLPEPDKVISTNNGMLFCYQFIGWDDCFESLNTYAIENGKGIATAVIDEQDLTNVEINGDSSLINFKFTLAVSPLVNGIEVLMGVQDSLYKNTTH